MKSDTNIFLRQSNKSVTITMDDQLLPPRPVKKSLMSFYERHRLVFRLVGHIFLWTLTWFLAQYSASAYIKDNQYVVLVATLILFSQTLLLYYALSLYVLPRYLYNLRIIPLLTSSLVAFWLVYLSNYYGFIYLSEFNTLTPINSPFGKLPYTVAMTQRLKASGIFGCFLDVRIALWNFAYSLYIVSIYLIVKAISDIVSFKNQASQLERDQLRLRVDNLQLKQENAELELNFLRSQVNPHSLFNVLNSVYADVFETNEKAADLILRLSELMRYNLYEADTPRIALDKELAYIQNYLNLERNRLAEQNISIDYDQNGPVEQYQIAPLLLIVFVENAFKHGVRGSHAAAYVEVYASVEDGKFTFQVENSVPIKRTVRAETKDPMVKSGGVGLSNVRRRLDALYGGQYELVVTSTEKSYTVVLTMQLEPTV